MNNVLTAEQATELLKKGFSRRALGRFATMITAGAALPFYNEPVMAQLSRVRGAMPADAVIINANENPLGPCPEAAGSGVRHADDEQALLFFFHIVRDAAKMVHLGLAGST